MKATHNAAWDLAKPLRDLGCFIFPLRKPSAPGDAPKRPALKWERYQEEAPSRQQMSAWYRKYPENNLAIITGRISGLVVVDGDGPQACAWIEAELPRTPWVVETAKGKHYFYRHPGGPKIGNRTGVRIFSRYPDGKPSDAIDLRGDGGYVVAPGSVHPSGQLYELVGELPASLDELPLYDRTWFPKPKPKPKKAKSNGARSSLDGISPWARKALDEEAATVRSATAGSRNHQLNVSAFNLGQLVGGGALPRDLVERTLREAAWTHVGQPGADGQPFTEQELRKTLASGLAGGEEKPRTEPTAAQEPSPANVEAMKEAQARRNETADAEDDEEKKPKKSQADLMVELVKRSGAELWHDQAGEPYITIRIDGRREHHRLSSKAVRDWLSRLLYKAVGKSPGGEARNSALGVLRGEALFDGAKREVAVRVAADDDGALWLDLGDKSWSAVQITNEGWEVVDDPDVYFVRPRGLAPLPEPERGGDLAELFEYVNVRPEDRCLITGWLAGAMRPTGPYPALVITGRQGSAKSTGTRTLRELVDPNVCPLRTSPRDERDLAVAAGNAHVVALDNLSGLPGWLSDALCRLSTGGGFATRELYSDREEAIFTYMRPAILNGITTPAGRPDLLDRSMIVELQPIAEESRRCAADVDAAFAEAHPRLLGALLDAVVVGLSREHEVHFDRLPRMADFAKWVEACAPGLGLKAGELLARFDEQRLDALSTAVEEHVVGPTLLAMLEERGETPWTGTATELLKALNARRGEGRAPKGWPTSPRRMTADLQRLAPALAAAGIEYDAGRTGRRRWHQLTYLGTPGLGRERDAPSHASQPSSITREGSLGPEFEGFAGDGCGDGLGDPGDNRHQGGDGMTDPSDNRHHDRHPRNGRRTAVEAPCDDGDGRDGPLRTSPNPDQRIGPSGRKVEVIGRMEGNGEGANGKKTTKKKTTREKD